LFESLKKKFSNVSKKLTKKVSDDAKEENNIEKEDLNEVEDNLSDSDDKKSLKDTEKSEQETVISDDEISKKQKSKTHEKDSKDDDKKESEVSEKDSEDDDKQSEDDKSKDKKKSSFRKWIPSFKRKKTDDDSDAESDSDKIDDETSHDESSSLQVSFDDDEKEEKKKSRFGFLSFIKEKSISEKDLEDILWELELGLLEGDVAMEVANAVVETLKENLIGVKIKRSDEVFTYTYAALRKAVSKIITIDGKKMTEMLEQAKSQGKPLVVMFVGINGTGKTTTIAKIANYYLKKGYNPVVAASDTFRAGAIEQISHHTDKIGIKIIKHQKGSDPAAVAFDAIEHAKSKGKELVLIDTAGRMQTNTNLMDEMKKIKRVAKPDLVIFVGDALTGNDAVEQATKFNDTIDIDGVILTKAEADSKGGASLSISYVIQKPIMFLGIGQGYDDIIEYDPEWVLEQLFD
jgi:fused signal recognition particle receptor